MLAKKKRENLFLGGEVEGRRKGTKEMFFPPPSFSADEEGEEKRFFSLGPSSFFKDPTKEGSSEAGLFRPGMLFFLSLPLPPTLATWMMQIDADLIPARMLRSPREEGGLWDVEFGQSLCALDGCECVCCPPSPPLPSPPHSETGKACKVS